MFKKIKENEKVIKFKELWQNPKTHDIAVLIFWCIFIFIVIIFVRGTTSTHTISNENNINNNTFQSIKNYDFTYKTNTLEINGQAYEDAMLFYLNNKRYYYKNDIYLIDDEITKQNMNPSILKINTKMLKSLTSDITPSKGDNFKQYIIPLDRFINLYEIDTDVDLTKATNYNIIMSVYEKENQINKITLDLTNYYALKNNDNTKQILNINYYNINNINDFRQNYDKLVEVTQ